RRLGLGLGLAAPGATAMAAAIATTTAALLPRRPRRIRHAGLLLASSPSLHDQARPAKSRLIGTLVTGPSFD
ncbi:MAG TPA: hypothetical protein VFI46_05615, partial [Jiangellaceae bacterium]|nr:hypothetical protein [Jiangellaceae bacterium]